MDRHVVLEKGWISRKEAASWLGCSVSTLANYAAQNVGHPFWKPANGRVVYYVPLIEEWR
jgi:hypothetical protein